MKTLKPGPRTEILADIAKAAKELKEDDFSELIKSIQTSKKNLEDLSEKIDWEQKVIEPILSVFDTDKIPENLANFENKVLELVEKVKIFLQPYWLKILAKIKK